MSEPAQPSEDERTRLMLDTAAAQRVAIVGTSGSGKTYAAKGLVEHLILGGARLCVIDPLGVWWGLRLGPDGKQEGGLPVMILGGLYADVPIEEHQGDAVGRAIATGALQCVVDVSELGSGAARRRFVTAMLDALYEKNRTRLHLVLDEADLWAPQRPRPENMALQGRVGEIVRRGRVRGFVPWLITQRPAVLDKDVLSQADVLIAMKLTSSQDRAAIGGWIEGQGDRAEERALLAALPKLQTGIGWLWDPGMRVLEEIAFPRIRTFDSSRTPEPGETPLAVGALLPTDTAALRQLLAGVGAEPAKAPAVSDANRRWEEGHAAGLREGIEQGRIEMQRRIDAVAERLLPLRELCQDLVAILRPDEAPPAAGPIETPKPATEIRRPQRPASKPDVTVPALTGQWPASRMRILGVLASRRPAPLTEAQWATLAGMSRKGGAWAAHIRALRTEGFVALEAGRFAVSRHGLATLNLEEVSPQGVEDAIAAWKRALGGAASRMIDALLQHRSGLSREALAASVDMTVTGGSFASAVRSLINNDLARQTGGLIALTPLLSGKTRPLKGAKR